MQKVIVLCGPTGVGKTYFSLRLANAFSGEIINADASQVYKMLDIGTAKAKDVQQKEVKHHLLDIKHPTETFSIKEYQELARAKIEELHQQQKLPLLVGGSGLYLNAVLYNYDLAYSKRIETFEEQFNPLSNEELHQKLIALMPDAAERIHPNNRRRILRMLSFAILDKRTSFQEEKDFVYDPLILFLNMDRNVLYNRINQRTSLMIQEGWLEEVAQLHLQGIDCSKLQAIGYKELSKVINDELSLEDAIEEIQQKTRRYAKRQITWFKNQLPSIEISVDLKDLDKTFQKINTHVQKFLNT